MRAGGAPLPCRVSWFHRSQPGGLSPGKRSLCPSCARKRSDDYPADLDGGAVGGLDPPGPLLYGCALVLLRKEAETARPETRRVISSLSCPPHVAGASTGGLAPWTSRTAPSSPSPRPGKTSSSSSGGLVG